MPANDDELLRRLRATFRVEAQEHAQTIASGLVALGRSAPAFSAQTVEALFRAAHSLKGAARAVNEHAVESLCQSLESVLAELQRRRSAPSEMQFDLLHRAVDLLARMLASASGNAAGAADTAAVPELRRALQAALLESAAAPAAAGMPAPAAPAAAPAAPALSDSIRVHKATLEAVLLQAEELLHAKLATAQHSAAMRALLERPAGWRSRCARLRDDTRAVAAALASAAGDAAVRSSWTRLRDFLDDCNEFVVALENDLQRHARTVERDRRLVAVMVDQLLDEMKQVIVQPFSTLLDLFPLSVRELARDRGKEIDLVVRGGDIQIDRRILDEIKDPLIHLVRNSVDHGIEAPAERRAAGKGARGRLEIAVNALDGSQVEVLVQDDGRGIDAQALHRAAIKAGVVAGDAAAQPPPAPELLALAFEPGVSTSPLITDLSGRGLGLSIVKETVQRLSGTLQLSSTPGQGARLRLVLPLTLARLRGVAVRAGGRLFVLPTRSVERVARVDRGEVRTIEGRASLSLDGRTLALVRLDAVLGLAAPAGAPEDSRLPVVVLGDTVERPIAFAVDEVVDEREVLLKPLGHPLQRVRHIAGATVFGGGQVVPILHVPDLLKSAVDAPRAVAAVGRDEAGAAPAHAVLVAEDSITSRALLKGVLEGAGYRVETAADGIEAFNALRTGSFDLVVSDVDMPRLNGFGLTARIRADRRLAELPVVLVTALESHADREHGIDAGANAYLVKSSFDQGNLLDIVRRLL